MIRYFYRISFLTSVFVLIIIGESQASDPRFEEIHRFKMPEARQGIAVDDTFMYVIGTRSIGKYNKINGESVAKWEENENGPIIHLDSGVIIAGKLYCAHSNYPAVPMTSSVEIWDAETLRHIDSHSFGIHWGSCTWVDRHNGYWWAAFAQYEKWKSVTGKGSEWTTLVKFDDQWHYLQAWVFPEDIIEMFRPMSNSGGSWGPDSLLYCTGHDRPELYAFQLPQKGSILELIRILPLNILGQGIAWDRSDRYILYGIRKKDNEVIVHKFITSN